jgi:CMP-N,N'-diacetyllegionaminic acid synthase
VIGAAEVLAIIPARGGSKGLPGKNIRVFAGLPLIAHSILYARMCPQLGRIVVSTDSAEIAAVAAEYEAKPPFIRPNVLAQDDTPMMPVLQHALSSMEKIERTTFQYVVLLDPTSPGREPADVSEAFVQLKSNPSADGIVSVSRPDFNPIWNCVTEKDGWMEDAFSGAKNFARRQDAPVVYRINGCLYIWRADFIKRTTASWRDAGKHLMYQIPESRAMSIDTLDEFKRCEVLVRAGLIQFPWLKNTE